ncbi:hypothetical protein K469DRAFT_717595 [Zopfia rhizophila CBS 207.26]|uniref:AA9 family lytic polysaccharide monooxygenase n=1 Tax=Zopfia rhizophila CBS 207.26 TaxID=1314779 RepID=A0A6A6DHX5_9PEZI|nr:hypothetical protein K469DRAFT_717595 [Zopfia rhizophila CBS 207.26]
MPTTSSPASSSTTPRRRNGNTSATCPVIPTTNTSQSLNSTKYAPITMPPCSQPTSTAGAMAWKHFGESDVNFTIPRTTPPGEYLMRIEHIIPAVENASQRYVNCTQVNIIGPGGVKLIFIY